MLFFIAPFVAEFLLGDLSLKLLPALIVLAPMYGGGALLIHEFARRRRRGWPTMLLLGAAYAVLEEGIVTQSLFNPNFLGFHFLQYAPLAWLGMGAWWTMLMFNVHAFWSIGVSIALAEALVPEHATEPWLGSVGEMIVAVLFVFGLVANAHVMYKMHPFLATPRQLAGAGIGCLLLIVLSFAIPRREGEKQVGVVPSPWLLGSIAFVLGFMVQIVPPVWGWGAVAALLVLDLVFLGMVWVLSRRAGWTLLHTFSLGAGGALEYGVHAFLQEPVGGGGGVIARVGNVIFLSIALVILIVGARRTAGFVRKAGVQAQRERGVEGERHAAGDDDPVARL
jgi:hypothetical protein